MNTPATVRVVRADGERQQMTAALERALFRVSGSLEPRASSSAFEKRAMLSVLADAIVACTNGGAVRDFAPYAWTPEAPAVLTALRRELLSGQSRRQWAERDLVAVATAIEDLQSALEGDVAVRFGEQFAGRNAQQRLVELAHDMRSPLNAILLLVERLQHGHNGPVTGAQQRHLALVYSAAFGLSGMANDLMDLARGGARLLGEEPRTFSVSDMLRKIRDVLQPLAEERAVTLRLSSPPLDKRVGQASALHRVILNLATNALKFTTVGSVTVLVQQETDPDLLTFFVEDTGAGIPEAELYEIFGDVLQTAHELPKTIKPNGMGLAICQKLVTAMHGELRAESRVDHGTRFRFTLRLPACA